MILIKGDLSLTRGNELGSHVNGGQGILNRGLGIVTDVFVRLWLRLRLGLGLWLCGCSGGCRSDERWAGLRAWHGLRSRHGNRPPLEGGVGGLRLGGWPLANTWK